MDRCEPTGPNGQLSMVKNRSSPVVARAEVLTVHGAREGARAAAVGESAVYYVVGLQGEAERVVADLGWGDVEVRRMLELPPLLTDSNFEIVGNELRLRAGTTLDFESQGSFDVTVQVDDAAVGATPDDTAALVGDRKDDTVTKAVICFIFFIGDDQPCFFQCLQVVF